MSCATSEGLARLCGDCDEPITVIAAHPDDEIIGVGTRLRRWSNARSVSVTDGAPRNLCDAFACGFSSREDYAQARRDELHAVLSRVGVPPNRITFLGLLDQEAARSLVDLTRTVKELLRTAAPAFVVTHPYEGGHPDHDATAFAVHAACELLAEDGEPVPSLVEMTSYHQGPNGIAPFEFLPRAECEELTIVLTPDERRLKQRLYDEFHTQRETLRWFSVDVERLRIAPRYDFTQPPHAGRLFYEQFDWGISGWDEWQRLATAALSALRLGGAR